MAEKKAARIEWQDDPRRPNDSTGWLGEHEVASVGKDSEGFYVLMSLRPLPQKLEERGNAPKSTFAGAKRAAQSMLNAYVQFLITGKFE